ncbi:hypothetical protein K443DRAFT_623268, partial [Laccaria amethystina LaAM-08-1]
EERRWRGWKEEHACGWWREKYPCRRREKHASWERHTVRSEDNAGKQKIPIGYGISPTHGMEVDETDADAEADAEAEAEILGAVEAIGGGDQEMVDPDGDGDAEAELLGAVDTAEANSSSSSSHGGRWMKEEEDGA